MPDQLVPVAAALSADVFGPLEGGERVMWRGRAGVAEYAFDRAASLPRWTLPETTDILVTDRRVIYAYGPENGDQLITSGELRWLWPQYLRLQPGARTAERGAAASQIQLVCGASDGSFPALVFAGGDLRTVADADRMANVLRQAIARFRVDHAKELGLSAGQARMLSRLLIGPEFINHQGGNGQTVSLLGAMLVQRRPAVATEAAEPASPVAAKPLVAAEPPVADESEPKRRPGVDADASRAWAAARAEQATQQDQPAVAERAADLAARVANLVAGGAALGARPLVEFENQTNLSAYLDVPASAAPRPRGAADEWPSEAGDRAESVRRTAARFAGNAARVRSNSAAARNDGEVGTSGRGSHRQG
jgi:hypothetical protein